MVSKPQLPRKPALLDKIARVSPKKVGLYASGAVGILALLLGPVPTLAVFAYSIAAIGGIVLAIIWVAHKRVKQLKACIDAAQSSLPGHVLSAAAAAASQHFVAPREERLDRRVTGANVIDEPLQQVITNLLRDYVDSWYVHVSADSNTDFRLQCRRILQDALVSLAGRCKEVDWKVFATKTVVDCFMGHLRLFRVAARLTQAEKEEEEQQQQPGRIRLNTGDAADIVDKFFFLEKNRHGPICKDTEREKAFLRDISEVILYLILPENDFHSRVGRFLARDILAASCIAPTVSNVANPDYVNQCIACYTSDSAVTYQAILEVTRTCTSLRELDIILENVEAAVTNKTLEAGTERETRYKALLETLLFAKGECKRRRIELMGEEPTSAGNEEGGGDRVLTPSFVLENHIALTYFREHLSEMRDPTLRFYLTVGVFRSTVTTNIAEKSQKKKQQQNQQSVGSAPSLDKETADQLRTDALQIFFEFLSDSADQLVPMPLEVTSRLYDTIVNLPVMPGAFDECEALALEQLRGPLYRSFLDSDPYHRCMHTLRLEADGRTGIVLDLISREEALSTTTKGSSGDKEADMADKDAEEEGEEGEEEVLFDPEEEAESPMNRPRSVSIMSTVSVGGGSDYTGNWRASILSSELLKQDNKSFVVYEIQAVNTSESGETDVWLCKRRYRDFDDLNCQLKDRYGKSIGKRLSRFPKKKVFGNTGKDFIQKRKLGLSGWLQDVTSPEVIDANPGVRRLVAKFLRAGEYQKGSRNMAVRALSAVASQVGLVTKTGVEDTLGATGQAGGGVEGFGGGKTISGTGGNGSTPLSKSKASGAATTAGNAAVGGDESGLAGSSGEDSNVPYRIALLLLDEVFGLQENRWLRKRVMVILKTVIRATMGTSINRKVDAAIEAATSTEAVVQYIVQFRDAWWPGGVSAPEASERSHDCCVRTRIEAKSKLLGMLPDELKALIGNKKAVQGMLGVFEMLQYERLNRRLVYTIFEELLKTLFPEANLVDIFDRAYSISQEGFRDSPTKRARARAAAANR
eukprot:UC1_evm2s1056